MLTAFFAALAQLFDGSLRRVFWLSVAISLALLALLALASSVALAWLAPVSVPGLDVLLAGLGALAGLGLGWLLFPSLTVAVIQLMAEPIARAVERRHYPDAPPPRQQPVREVLILSLNLAALSLLVNLMALPAYLLLPALNLVIYLIFNGYIVARGYFETAAGRRFEPALQRDLWQTHRRRLWPFGAGLALLLSIPIVNLAAPIVALAAMVHLVERMRHRQTGK
jgi:uncharacterized protein involved in cysteine biosynthesis